MEFQEHSANPSGKSFTCQRNVGMTMRAISNKLIKTSRPINHQHTSAHLLHVPAEISTVLYQGITEQNKQVSHDPESHCLLLTKGNSALGGLALKPAQVSREMGE